MFNRVKLMMAVALGRMLGSAPFSLHKAAMDHNRTVDAMRANAERERVQVLPPPVVGPRGVGAFLSGWAARLVPARHLDRSNMHWGPNGAQAMARRVRQMRNGHCSASLLWVDSQGRRWHTDPHGVHRGFYWDSSAV